jgi:hypothetical protein
MDHDMALAIVAIVSGQPIGQDFTHSNVKAVAPESVARVSPTAT